MKRYLAVVAVAATLLSAATALAAEQTVTLSVDGMFCASCPYIVKQSLIRVEGVKDVSVSFKRKTAVVTFDDVVTDVAALTAATAGMGFPSAVVER